MVRLVFRPYAQVRRSICTSESLRASTRVSPGFTLLRHSSPSFGSQHVCSHSDHSPEGLGPADCAINSSHYYFHCALGFCTHVLAHMLNSLVRVSRRGEQNHFAESSHTCGRFPQAQPDQAAPAKTPICKQKRSWRDCTLVSFASLSAISGTL